jgi:hypothetical protein
MQVYFSHSLIAVRMMYLSFVAIFKNFEEFENDKHFNTKKDIPRS